MTTRKDGGRAHTFAALVRRAVIAEGGKHSINIADGSELLARVLDELQTWPFGDVAALLTRASRRRKS